MENSNEVVQIISEGVEVFEAQERAAIDTQVSTAKKYPRNLTRVRLNSVAIATMNNDAFPFSNPTVDYGNVFSAMAIMIFLGLIIGLIPAQRAVKIKPIEALRSE